MIDPIPSIERMKVRASLTSASAIAWLTATVENFDIQPVLNFISQLDMFVASATSGAIDLYQMGTVAVASFLTWAAAFRKGHSQYDPK
ncbi:MAG: hypothetical protein KAG66_03080 [Methylococcales bacterium]|nr:hypothetical protein [Methylococcales bacterium]